MIQEILNEELAIMDVIYELKNFIADEEMKREEYECNLWVNTKFADLGLSNADQRKAYVKKEMGNVINNISKLKNDLAYAENQLKLLKTKEKLILEFGLDILEK